MAERARRLFGSRSERGGAMTGSPVRRIHNPRHPTCGCASDCWCQTSAVGRVVRWWFPARLFGMPHKARGSAEWKRACHVGERWSRAPDPMS